MKPIIIDMNDMTDSSEVYESKPNPWLSYFIYFVLAILITGFAWAYFSKIDIIVKANGVIKINNNTIISADISGRINSLTVLDGKLVKKGDLLAKIDSEEIGNAIKGIDKTLGETNERIDILKAYESFLNGETNVLDEKNDNKYYSEILSRKNLLNLNNSNIEKNIEEKKASYKAELSSASNKIKQLNNQISRIDKAISSVSNLENLVSSSDEYYNSLVSTFLSNYNITTNKYDKQIQVLVDEKKILRESITDTNNSNEEAVKEDISSKETNLDNSIEKLKNEKKSELSNLKMQQITLLEQEKNTINTSKTTLNSNKKMIESQLNILNNSDIGNSKNINIETEKQSVAKELLSYEEKKTELENKQKQYDIQSGKTNIIANEDGYISFASDLKEGSYVNQGQAIFKILPDDFENYEVEIFVVNSDIGKVKENQTIKLEIPAYPSSEYGFITSKITSISKETKVDEKTGQSFYIVKAIIERDKVNKNINLNNGMLSYARIVVDEKRVLRYVLEKINLWD
ncbi:MULTISPECIES: HlyD family efflux transporter periplasmic adaptor subunit [Helcococcus]|uniref:HlyD family efflux transporter periplasmic adaptor subunit n=1 Tax=Helcococcus bovis TaxID=3153252 RepID=A0ABW9F8F5_9FIRM